MDSTREEVLAAVAEEDARQRESMDLVARYSDDQIDWRGASPGEREGCYVSFDGNCWVMVRPENPNSVRARQERAGQEDQSVEASEWGA